MDKLSQIERDRGIILPEIYKDFYWNCSGYTPENLVGTDLVNKHPELNEWAIELLEEDGVENFLEENDFVFLMHQGYIFWYFKADGNTDPIVFRYHEVDTEHKSCGVFSSFIKEYLQANLFLPVF